MTAYKQLESITESTWKAIVKEWIAGGASLAELAARHGHSWRTVHAVLAIEELI